MGKLSALQWEDIDFKKKVIHVKHTLCYFSKNGKYVFEMQDTKQIEMPNGYKVNALLVYEIYRDGTYPGVTYGNTILIFNPIILK